MPTVSLEDAQARLGELIDSLGPDDVIEITRDEKPVARITATGSGDKSARKLGTMRGSILYMAPDFDAPLEEFKDYME